MQLRWYIEVNGNKILQYRDDNGYWQEVDVELEVKKEWEVQRQLRDRIRELENDYKMLSRAIDDINYGK